MRHKIVTLMAVVTLVATINAVSTAAASLDVRPEISAWTRSITSQQDKRLLRAREYKATEEDEERVAGTSAVESLVKVTAKADDLEGWLTRGDTTNYVFKALKLQKAGDSILDNPQLTTWISYMKLFNEANPTKKTSLVATLTAHYGNQGLTKIIEAGLMSTSKNTATVAKRLQNEQIQRWMVQGKSPENVFGLLKLDKLLPFTWISSDLFEKPGLNTWIRYLDDFNAENPEKKTTLMAIFSKRYNDKTLANMLIAANKVESTSSFAKRIQAEQTQLWQKNGKQPADIFTMLQLDKAADKLFENPLFSAWIKYADDFRLLHDTELATMSTLIRHYSDETVAKMIMAAYETPSTKSIAKRLQSELQRDWLFAGQSPDDVFITMNLDRTMDKMLENPLFDIWYQYGLYFNKMNPKRKWDPIEALTHVYGGDKQLADALMSAVKVPSTKSMASELQSSQITRWLVQKKKPAEVSTLLGAEGATADDISSILYKKYAEGYDEYLRLFQRR